MQQLLNTWLQNLTRLMQMSKTNLLWVSDPLSKHNVMLRAPASFADAYNLARQASTLPENVSSIIAQATGVSQENYLQQEINTIQEGQQEIVKQLQHLNIRSGSKSPPAKRVRYIYMYMVYDGKKPVGKLLAAISKHGSKLRLVRQRKAF